MNWCIAELLTGLFWQGVCEDIHGKGTSMKYVPAKAAVAALLGLALVGCQPGAVQTNATAICQW